MGVLVLEEQVVTAECRVHEAVEVLVAQVDDLVTEGSGAEGHCVDLVFRDFVLTCVTDEFQHLLSPFPCCLRVA